MSGLEFRSATDSDWGEIYRIFCEVTATADTYPFQPDTPESEAREVWMGSPKSVFVALDGDEIVATAFVRPNQTGLSDHVANAGWMVDPARQGEGIGRPFAEYVLDRAREMGYLAMQFNAVVASNEKAISLWKSMGFRIVGTVPDAFRHASLGLTPVHIMYRKL